MLDMTGGREVGGYDWCVLRSPVCSDKSRIERARAKNNNRKAPLQPKMVHGSQSYTWYVYIYIFFSTVGTVDVCFFEYSTKWLPRSSLFPRVVTACAGSIVDTSLCNSSPVLCVGFCSFYASCRRQVDARA